MTKSKLSWSAYLLALFLPFTYSAFAQDQADKPEGDAPADGDAPAADGGGDAPAADAPAAGGDTAGGGDAPAADTPAPAAGGDAAAAPAAPAADAAPATPATDAAAAPSPAPAAAPAAPAGDAPAAPSPAAPAPAPAAPATAAPAPAAPAPVAPAPAPVVAAPAPAPPPPAPIAPPPPPPPPPAALTLESNPITQAVVATGGAISISDVVSIGSSNIKKMAANPNDGAGGNVLNDLNRNLKARVSVVKAFEGVADVETLVNEAVKIKKDELESLNELSRDEAKALRNNATDATKIGQVATKAKVVKTFKDSGVAVSSFDKINDLDDDNLDALKKIDTSTLGVLAKSGAGSGASALALNDIDKFATKAELAVTFFEDTSAPADPNDIAIIEFDATKLEQLDTQINALDTSALDNFKKMDKDVLDVLAKSGSGNSAARLDISSIDKVAAKAKMAVAVLGSAGNAPIDFDAAKIAQVDTYINAIEDDFLDAIDEIDITNLTNDKDGNAFDITKVDKIASKAAVVKTFTDLDNLTPTPIVLISPNLTTLKKILWMLSLLLSPNNFKTSPRMDPDRQISLAWTILLLKQNLQRF